MNRRGFLAGTLSALPSLALPDVAGSASVKEVLVLFKCHFDAGFVDTQAAIIQRYFTQHFPGAIETAAQLRASGGDRYVWTTGSWLLYQYLQSASAGDKQTMEAAIRRGDIAWHALPFTWQSELLDRSAITGCIGFSKALDRRFGTRTTGAKMTDVPGHTRGLLAPLHWAGIKFLDIGVNAASTPPDVPELFVWRDGDANSVIVMYHHHDYGGVVRVPRSPLAVAVEVRDDNSGPHTLDEIHAIYAKLRAQFPGAQIRASNLTEIANSVSRYERNLPVFRNEIGDTWIYGVASDPIKLARYRELLRLRAEWVESKKITPADPIDLAFLSRFALAAEHTWGTDTKTWLDFDHYTPQALQSIINDPKYRTVAGSWIEKRRDIDDGVQTLPAPLRDEAKARLATLTPRRPDTAALKQIEVGEFIETAQFRLRVHPQTGALVSVEHKASGKQFASAANPLALFRYQTLSQADYARFLKDYITVDKDWAPKDFGKPNIGRFGAQSKVWQASNTDIWVTNRNDADCIIVKLHMDKQAADALTAWPENVFLQIDAPPNEPVLNLTLSWFNKRANRMPEALWLTYQPMGADRPNWIMSKLGNDVSPLEVVAGGNRHMHALTGPLAYSDSDRSISIESLDAAVISLGELSPIYFSREQPDLSKGFHYSLFNNGWGTNYIQWFGEDAQFRFQVRLA